MKFHITLKVILCLLLVGCASPKEIVYLQDAENQGIQKIDRKYEAVIHEDDLLSIIVSSKDAELAMPFNMPLVTVQIDGSKYNQQRVLGYQVDKNGDIDFPVLGKLKVGGLTRTELTELIKHRLVSGDYIKDPVVTVQFQNFKVSVMGEVARPGSFNVAGDRITLLEALSMAGDLTIYGRRDRVAVIREENGRRTVKYHVLRKADVFKSPYYYLRQNDVVYVEPNKTKAGQSGINQNNSVGVWVSVVSLLTTVAVLIFK